MEDSDAKRLKNNSDSQSNVPNNRMGQSTSITKGTTLGLLTSDTIWVTPRVVRKEFETSALGDSASILHVQGQSLAAAKICLHSDQKNDTKVVSGDSSVTEVPLMVQTETDGPAMLEVFIAVPGNSTAGTALPGVTAILPAIDAANAPAGCDAAAPYKHIVELASPAAPSKVESASPVVVECSPSKGYTRGASAMPSDILAMGDGFGAIAFGEVQVKPAATKDRLLGQLVTSPTR